MANFARLFGDSAYWNSLVNTFILTFGKLAVEIPLALLLAVLLNKGRKEQEFLELPFLCHCY